MTALTFTAAYAAWGALCFAMRPHARAALGVKPPTALVYAMQVIAALLFALALYAAWRASAHIGIVLWLGALIASALTLTILLRSAPRAAALSALAALIAALWLTACLTR